MKCLCFYRGDLSRSPSLCRPQDHSHSFLVWHQKQTCTNSCAYTLTQVNCRCPGCLGVPTLPGIRSVMGAFVNVCVSEGHSWGEQSPIHANFSLDYMNWLSVLAEARHAWPQHRQPPSSLPNPDASLTQVTVLLRWAGALNGPLIYWLSLLSQGQAVHLSSHAE